MNGFKRELCWAVLGAGLLAGPLALAQQGGGPPSDGTAQQGGGTPDHGGTQHGIARPGMGHHVPPMGMGMMPPDRWWDDNGFVDRLHITPEQQTKMDSIFDQSRPKLMDSLKSDSPNEQAILTQIDHVAEARANLEKTRARMLLALRAELTHEQWVALSKARQQGPPPPPGGPGQPDGPGPDHGGRGGPGGQGAPDGPGGPQAPGV